MDFKYFVSQLEHNISVFESLLINKTEKEYLWRPNQEKWCLLEIVCHLVDEEQDDFRARVKHTLENPNMPLKPINPEGWVKERDYISKDYKDTLLLFLKERKSSILWLTSLKDVLWDNAINHPDLGKLSAELFLTNWLAHDYLHIRQIMKYKYDYLKLKTNLDLSYAGNW